MLFSSFSLCLSSRLLFSPNGLVTRKFSSLSSSRRLLESSLWFNMSGRNQMRPSSDLTKFRSIFGQSKHIVAITGAGISAESGVPTFRGSGGLWRTYRATELATPSAFERNPSLVWEFYSYRREVVLTKSPNAAHIALAEAETRLAQEGRKLVIITQNIDELHRKAGSSNVIELHGTLFKTRCLKCGDVSANYDSPICEALRGKGSPDADTMESVIKIDQLPHCKKPGCHGLLRPNVVWFNESLHESDLRLAEQQLTQCDLVLVIGTSSAVYPAASLAPSAAARGVPVAEFNIEETSATNDFGFHFQGPCGKTLPAALAP
ncbi:NAD-dependent protein deacylase-like [Panonychus citri]|uniref:NAD-dependent protein deacylase-like n=1 Tax=Panonychus citri TaxID=50023 RepID=UPI0023072B07|nr:NAD-dependent protein deacylase-like [Panonychus citri]